MVHFDMRIRFKNYKYDFRIASLALEENTKIDLLKNNLSVIYVDDKKIMLYPEETVLSDIPSTCTVRSVKDVIVYWMPSTSKS